MKFSLKNKYITAVLTLFIFLSFLLVIKNQYFPYSLIASPLRELVRYIKVIYQEDLYLTQVIKSQSLSQSRSSTSSTIETSLLPINIEKISLPVGFLSAGGGITKINNQLIIMSRTGDFYKYQEGNFAKLDFGLLPNRLKDYVLYSNYPLSSDHFRVHSLAYDDFNSKLYVSFTEYLSPKLNRLVISSILIDPFTFSKKGGWEEEFASDPISSKYSSQAGGGRLTISGEKLYFSVGYADGTITDPKSGIPESQNLATSFGKIYQLDLKTHIIKNLSFGHRNVQGITVTNSGEILSTEHGLQGGDEINIIIEGKNYGWPYRAYTTDYGAYTFKNSGFKIPENFNSEEPLYVFVPSVGLSPIITIEQFHPKWDNNLLAGTLKAQSLYRIEYKNGRIILTEPIWIGHRIRDIFQFNKNEIVLLTDDSFLIFLSINNSILQRNQKNAGYNFEPLIQKCLTCHHFEQSTPSSMAPSLANIKGRKIGNDLFFKYSSALKNANGIWDEKSLTLFLKNPQQLFPGTVKPNLGLSEDEAKKIAKILTK